MPTEFSKPVRRRVGNLVVTITADGVELRAFRRRKCLRLTWSQLAKQGLKEAGYSLTQKEWEQPTKQLRRLARLPQR